MIRVVGKRGKGSFESQLDEAAKGLDFVRIDCTSCNQDEVMNRGLSPFYLGPVECYDGLVAQRFELAWQCAKVYPTLKDKNGNVRPEYPQLIAEDGLPGPDYFKWRDEMWAKTEKDFPTPGDMRRPAGKGNSKNCKYAWWKVDGEFRKLGYVAARKAIYIPLYAKAVVKTEAYRRLVELRDVGKNLMLIDFDGYNPYHPHFGFASDDAVRTYNDVIHCPLLLMGHGFTLAMLLEGLINVDEKGNVTYADGLMDDPHHTYSCDVRKLPEDEKLLRGARAAGVTLEEWAVLSPSDRTLLRVAARKENVKSRGYTKAAWKRLPLSEKLAMLRVRE
ncbi:MAG: hypothetical protein IJH50_06800 [Kiritimatiellae bacterium]|nr:hypothetical protein [Kiritimatiellia bacterium]